MQRSGSQLSNVPLSNWIQARFAGGVDFVSDAPEDVAEAIERAMRRRPLEDPGPEFGWFLLPGRDLSVAYLRCAANGGTPYVHAVAWQGAPQHPSAEAVERFFGTRYGQPPGPRAQALVRRLASARLAEAMRPLAELFLAADALAGLESVKPRAKREPESSSPRIPNPTRFVPWIVTAVAVVVAGFAVGRTPPGEPVSVDAAPPGFEERLSRLEAALQPAEPSLRAQLESERLLHAEALAAKQLEIDALAARLAKLELPGAAAEIAQQVAGPAAPESAARKTAGSEASSSVAAVSADVLWVREGPGTQHRKLARLEIGDRVELAGVARGDWTRIAAPARGWVATKFLAPPE